MADARTDQREQPTSRFSLWTALTGFSVVVLADIASTTKDEPDRSRAQRWAMAVSCISLSLGALAVLAHVIVRDRFVATPIEGGLITLSLGFWAAGLPSMMNPKNEVAVSSGYIGNGDFITNESGVILTTLQANVYFFSWAAFVVSLLLAGSFAREVVQVQMPQNIPRRSLWWYGLCATSFAVMSTASRSFHLTGCKDPHTFEASGVIIDPSGVCKRVKFGVALGVVSGVFAVVMGSVSHLLPVVLESVASAMMMILWCFGVGFVTFGSKAPAANVGNFYFSTWASFIITLFLVSDAVAETYRKLRGDDTTTTTTETSSKATQPDSQSRV